MTYMCVVKGKVDLRIDDVTERELGPTVAMWCSPDNSVEVFARTGTAEDLKRVRKNMTNLNYKAKAF